MSDFRSAPWTALRDVSALMYNHRTEKTRVDVVDLDPYGTAAPFIDAAVQSVNSGGESTTRGAAL
jgi:tRNA G26 N,N-dimethylase Trm1